MNLKGLGHKQRFFLLLCALGVLLLSSYWMSLKKTFGARSEYKALAEQLEASATLDEDLQRWRTLNLALDQELGGQLALTGFHENLLNVVGLFCEENKVVLSEFSEPFEGSEGGYKVETIILKIAGSYKPLLMLIHHLETEFKGGKIASVEFVKEKNFRKNRDELFLKLYVQKVSRDEDS